MKDTPIVIIAFNRLVCLRQLIDALVLRGYSNLHIMDNASDYEPLLQFYAENQENFNIVRLKQNFGHAVLRATGLISEFNQGHFVVTDPDIIPIDECPDDFLTVFAEYRIRYQSDKVGFGLKIDDLPDGYPQKQQVIAWESAFWQSPAEPDLYRAAIDTTFALCAPGTDGSLTWNALRTGGKYTARHLPWYEVNPREDVLHYRQSHKVSGNWL